VIDSFEISIENQGLLFISKMVLGGYEVSLLYKLNTIL